MKIFVYFSENLCYHIDKINKSIIMDEPKKISKLEKLYNEAQEDFKLTQLNLSEKTKEMPAIKNKWIFLYTMEQKRLAKLEETRDTMIEMFVQANSGQRGGEFKAKLDATKQEDILALENKISNQKDVIRFLDLIMQNQIKTITWDVKNAIDHLKLEQGSL